MKTYTAFLLLLVFSFTSCRKKNVICEGVSQAAESGIIAGFCKDNGINYSADANGIYYEIIQQGSGSFPADDSLITVTYSATGLDGTVYFSLTPDTPVKDYLYNFIEGWRLALPYIQKGGHIKMVIPSSLCYGCSGSDAIPPNTPLYFDIYLIDVSR